RTLLGHLYVAFVGADFDDLLIYKTEWIGNKAYDFGLDQSYTGSTSGLVDSFEASAVYVWIESLPYTYNDIRADGYFLGDNTAGTMEFTFPESGTAEVPEPSSLLALAFGGAGTVLAIRKRK
ncbi:MAG: PEP-CTERM sorting domain-containing protein, partial [Abditibacteriota bacterium]|nr:PEP-CTERM sorting domain-containing protein [Abditibacteriota bacterium]